MSGTIKKNFELASLKDLQLLFEHVKVLEANGYFAAQYDAMSKDITQGRSFSGMVYADLISDFEFMMSAVPAKDIPYSFYRQLLQIKDKKDIGLPAAKKKLNAAIADKVPLKPGENPKPPEFIAILDASVTQAVRRVIEAGYINLLDSIHAQIFQKDDTQPIVHSQVMVRKLQAAFHSPEHDFKMSKTKFEEVVEQAYAGMEEETDEEAAAAKVAVDPEESAISRYDELKGRFKEKKESLPEIIQKTVSVELRRLKTMGDHSNEYGNTIDYIELLLDLPWEKQPHQKVSLKGATQKLNATHHGMKKVKERCIEYIAAMNTGGKSGGAICLDGPPGVGKTSIAKSIAAVLRRPCFTVPMSSVDDVTLLNGHGRTYSGSLPGLIIRGMRRAGVTNPVIILDEGDKAGGPSQRGNPTNAMLELINPEQNSEFKDHYLGVEYDLSDALFIMTTNDVESLPSAVIDRLEIIPVDYYTDEEKMEIARKHLVPKSLEQCGLSARQVTFKDDALAKLIADYTREAGVRNLERLIKRVCRKENVLFQQGKAKSAVVSAKTLETLIGPPQIHKTLIPDENQVGIINGLHASEYGGGLVPIQVTIRPSEKLTVKVTGLPGPMLKESVAYSAEGLEYLAKRYTIDIKKVRKSNIHIHITSMGAEGPSAGAAITAAIVSAFTGIKVDRQVALTGEIDTRGNVLPIGGLKEKLDGARKAGVHTVLIPWGNQRSLYHVPKHLKDAVNIIPVKHIDEVLQYALLEPVPLRTDIPQQSASDKMEDLSSEDKTALLRFLISAAAKEITGTDRTSEPRLNNVTTKPPKPAVC